MTVTSDDAMISIHTFLTEGDHITQNNQQFYI